MDPITIGLILAAMGTGASTGASVWGSKKQRKHEDEVKAFNKKQQDNAEREARREALARAIKAKDVSYMPQSAPMAPEAPSMMGPQILKGIGDVAQTAGSMYAAKGYKPYSQMPGADGLLKGVGGYR